MRFLSLLSTAGLLAQAACTPIAARESQNAGYLAAIFKGDEPSVFFYIASAQNPTTFQALNGGKPYLVPTGGTGGARDPFILKANNPSDAKQFYVLATDLDIGKTNWGAAQTHGSRSIYIWHSADGVSWSTSRLAELMPSTAGYVWAPSAVWDQDRSAYAVFWSSVVFAADDLQHTGRSEGPFIFYSHTTDFQDFTSAARWNPDNNDTVIDQEIQHIGGNSYVRYLSDTNRYKRVIVERSDTGVFGTWNFIGIPVDQTREGPASYQDILRPERNYLWEDNYGGPGYECYWTEDFKTPYYPCSPGLTPTGMRHGGVTQISETVYQNLQTKA